MSDAYCPSGAPKSSASSELRNLKPGSCAEILILNVVSSETTTHFAEFSSRPSDVHANLTRSIAVKTFSAEPPSERSSKYHVLNEVSGADAAV